MGSKQSKESASAVAAAESERLRLVEGEAAAAAEAARKKEEAESRNRLLMKAYQDGREEAAFEAMRALEAQRQEDLMMAMGACFLSAVLSSMMVYASRDGAASKTAKREMEESKALVTQQHQEIALERQRVQELAAVNDSHKLLLANQQRLIEKSREQSAMMRARMHSMRLEHAKLKRRHSSLRVEVKTLRTQNGVLHQRFIASTAGAIFMACVAGGFAIASHGGHDSNHSSTTTAAETKPHAQE